MEPIVVLAQSIVSLLNAGAGAAGHVPHAIETADP